MAILTHVSAIKNSNYKQGVEYCMYKHDEKGLILKDENGFEIERENYLISCQNVSAVELYNIECQKTNEQYNVNQNQNDVKAHHYVLSFEESEKELSLEKAHALAQEHAKELFGAHQAIICTHGDTDNIHSHIFFNSVRIKEIEKASWMSEKDGHIKPCRYEEGKKFSDTNGFNRMAQNKTMEMCERENLKQINLFKSNNKSSTKDYYANLRGNERLDLAHAVDTARLKTTNYNDMLAYLKKNYNVESSVSRQGNERLIYPGTNNKYRLDKLESAKDLTKDTKGIAAYGSNYKSISDTLEIKSQSKFITDKEDLRIALDRAKIKTSNYEEMKAYLKTNYSVDSETKERKGAEYLKLTHPESNKTYRTDRLGEDYKVDNLKEYFKNKEKEKGDNKSMTDEEYKEYQKQQEEKEMAATNQREDMMKKDAQEHVVGINNENIHKDEASHLDEKKLVNVELNQSMHGGGKENANEQDRNRNGNGKSEQGVDVAEIERQRIARETELRKFELEELERGKSETDKHDKENEREDKRVRDGEEKARESVKESAKRENERQHNVGGKSR